MAAFIYLIGRFWQCRTELRLSRVCPLCVCANLHKLVYVCTRSVLSKCIISAQINPRQIYCGELVGLWGAECGHVPTPLFTINSFPSERNHLCRRFVTIGPSNEKLLLEGDAEMLPDDTEAQMSCRPCIFLCACVEVQEINVCVLCLKAVIVNFKKRCY